MKRSRDGAKKRPSKRARTIPISSPPRYPQLARISGYYGKELKFFDTALSFLIDNTGEVPTTGQLTLIPQGVTESTRIGRKCVVKSVHMRGVYVYQPSTSATAAVVTFMYLVLDRQANGAAAAVTDVLTSNEMYSAFSNMANSERFKILKRFVVDFSPTAGVTTAYNNVRKPFEYYSKLDIPIEYSSTTGAISEIKSCNLFLLAGTDGGADDLVTVAGTCRLRFSDG